MKKLGALFSLLCIMNMLAIVGLVGYLFGTGRLDKPKVGAIVTMVRHQGTPEKLNEKLFDILEPTPTTNPAAAATSQPASADGGTPDATLGASAQDRLSIAAQAMQQERLRLDARAQELRNQQELLAQNQAKVEAKLNEIKDLKEAYDKQVAAAVKKAVDDNFQKSLDLYNELKSKQVKDMFLAMNARISSPVTSRQWILPAPPRSSGSSKPTKPPSFPRASSSASAPLARALHQVPRQQGAAVALPPHQEPDAGSIMSLIANRFAPSRSLKPSTQTPSSSTSDNSPSFNDALDSALQPQGSPAPQPQAAATPESKPQRSEKKTDQTDDASDDQPAATDDSTPSAGASPSQTSPAPAQSAQPSPTKKPAAAKDDQDPQDHSTDPTLQQIAASVPVQPQMQPLPLTQVAALQKAAPAAPLVAGQPVPGTPPSLQNKNAQQSTPAQPAAPAQPADNSQAQPNAAKIPPPAAPEEATNSQAPSIKPSLKRASDSPRPTVVTPTKPGDKSATTADATPDADSLSTPTPASDPSTPSPLATQHTNPKFATSAAQTTQSSDSPASQSSTPATAQTQSPTPDPTRHAESIKYLPSAPSTDDPAPAAPQSGATPIHTLTTGSNHPVDNSATPAAPAQDSPRTEPDPTFDQIVLGLRTKMDATHSRAEISLNPPNLGTLHVSVSLQNGSLTAQFQSSSEVVRDLLKGNMEKLKSVLESQGVTVDNLAVGAPQDKTELPSAAPATAQTNQSANDGRSAGQYNQEPQNRKRSQDSSAFAKTWQHANAKAPIDLVA